jgi:hypothetical protein
MCEESMNGVSMRRLAGSEWSAVVYLGDGESGAKGKKEASAIGSFIAERERGSWQHAHTSALTVDVEAVQWQ